MSPETVEQRLERLEHKLDRVEAAVECTRIMNRFTYLNTQKRNKDINAMFAKKTPGVHVALGQLGFFDGPEGVDRIYGDRPMVPEGAPGQQGLQHSRVGHIYLHPLASQYIEVAGDCRTAKGVCLSIGIESGSDRYTGRLTPCWGWGSYGIDFIKEDGEWKIWHFHIYRIFRAPYHESWTAWDPDEEIRSPMPGPFDLKGDRPPKDDCPYDPRKEFVFKPDPPDPYETFDPAAEY